MTDCDITYTAEDCCEPPILVRPGPPVINPPPPPSIPPVASVTVTLQPTIILVNGTAQAFATLRDGNGNILTGVSVSWFSLTPSVASINSAGLIIGLSVGTTVIRGIAQGVNGTATLTVVPDNTPPTVATVTVTLVPTAIQIGDTSAASAVLKDGAGNVLTGILVAWWSQVVAVATIDPTSGLITGVGAGVSLITATAQGIDGTANITVSAAPPPPPTVATVTVNVSPPSVTAGDLAAATAILRDNLGNILNGIPTTWVSGTPAVATIDAGGLITSIAVGTSIITGTAQGIDGTGILTVVAVPPPPPPPTGGSWPSIPSSYTPPAGLSYNQNTGRWSGTVITTPYVPQTVVQNFVDTGNATTNGINLQTMINQAAQAQIRRKIIIPVNTYIRVNVLVLKHNAGAGWFELEAANYVTPTRVPTSGAGMFILESINTLPAIESEWQTGPVNNSHGRYAFKGAEIRFDPAVGLGGPDSGCTAIVRLGVPFNQNALPAVPDGYYFEGCWIHGWQNNHSRRGVEWHCANLHMFRCRIDQIHNKFANPFAVGGDSQCITSWNGPGPIFLDEVVLSGADECIVTGGSPPLIPNLTPSHQHYRRCRTEKPASMDLNNWGTKNHMEWKFGAHILVEECAHVGFPGYYDNLQQVVYGLKRYDENGLFLAAQFHDFLSFNCYSDRVPSLMYLITDGTGKTDPAREHPRRIHIINFLGKNMNEAGDNATGINAITCTWPTGCPSDIYWDHITLVTDTGTTLDGTFRAYGGGGVLRNFTWKNSLVAFNGQIIPTAFAGGIQGFAGQGSAVLADDFAGVIDVRNIHFIKTNNSGSPQPVQLAGYPASCKAYTNYSDVGFRDIPNGDFGLSNSSPSKNAATDGFDIGVHNYDALMARILTVPT